MNHPSNPERIFVLSILFIFSSFFGQNISAQSCSAGETAYSYCYGAGEVNTVAFQVCPSVGMLAQAEITQGTFDDFFPNGLTVYQGPMGSGTGGTSVFSQINGDVSGNTLTSTVPDDCLIFVINTIDFPGFACNDMGGYLAVEVCGSSLPATTVSFTAPADLCINAGIQSGLTGGMPPGGMYSGDGVTDMGGTYSFNPVTAGVGTTTITYTTMDGMASDDVEVVALPTLGAFTTVCEDAGESTLGGGTPTGGVYSGPGVTNDGNGMTFTFNPAHAGQGMHTITYTASGVCVGETATSSITVNPPCNSPCMMGQNYEFYCYDNNETELVIFEVCPSSGMVLDATIAQGRYAGPNADSLKVYSGASGSSTGGTLIFNMFGELAGQTFFTTVPDECMIFVSNSNSTGSCRDLDFVLPLQVCTEESEPGPYWINPGNFCFDDDPQTGLTGGNPTGGVYSGDGVDDDMNGMTFTFDPAVAGLGLVTIFYTVSGETVQTTVMVTQPSVTFTAPDDMCVSDAPTFHSSLGSPTGGMYDGPGVFDFGDGTNFLFTPADAGVGMHTITYTFTDANGCSAVASDDIVVFGPPTVTMIAPDDLCIDAGEQFNLSGGTPAQGSEIDDMGEYTGAGVNDDGNGMTFSFDPAEAGVGMHIITYTYTTGIGCSDSDTDTVEVFALPTVVMTAPDDLCIDAGIEALNGGTPAQGTETGDMGVYSGDGVIDNMDGTYSFDPADAGPGMHTITYEYTDGNGCTDFAQDDIIVLDTTLISFPPLSAICLDDGIQSDLGEATPTGGVYSGEGVTDQNGMTFTFDPSITGTSIITYTFENESGCSSIDYEVLTVNDITITPSSINELCTSMNGTATAIVSGGSGNYSYLWSNGATGNPIVGLSTGNYFVTVTDDITDCTKETTVFVDQTITMPIVSFTAPDDLCIDDELQDLTAGTPPQGTVIGDMGVYSGPGVIDNMDGTYSFDPATATPGIHIITYSYTDENGCSDSKSDVVEVFALPIVGMTAPADQCLDGEIQVLDGGTPAQGTQVDDLGVYSGPGVIDNMDGTYSFDPATATAGIHTITYSYTDENGCTDSKSDMVEVFDLSTIEVTLDIMIPYICSEVPDPGATLGGGLPQGGIYTGIGVTDGENGLTFTFDPSISGPGMTTLTYTYSDENGCTSSASQEINIIDCTPSISDPCRCLDNATILDLDNNSGGDDGQFAELVSIGDESGMALPDDQIWTITAASNSYDAFNVPAYGMQSAGIPIPSDGTVMLTYDMITGDYEIPFVHVDDVGYSLTIEGPFTVGDPANSIFIIDNICRYPNPVFDPSVPDDICPTSPDFIFGGFDTNGQIADNVTFEVNGMPAMDFDPQEMDPGTYTVVMTFDGGADANEGISPDGSLAAAPGCIQTVRKTIELSEPISNMSCVGAMNLSLSSDCTLELYSELFFPDNAFRCYDDYIIKVNGEVQFNIEETGVYIITIEDPVNGNNCWSTLTIEDKIGPVFPEMCTWEEPCRYLCKDFNYTTRRIEGVTDLTEGDLDDCSGVTLFGPTVIYKKADDCSEPDTVIYHYSAKDDNGFTSKMSYYYLLVKETLADVIYPPHYDGIDFHTGINDNGVGSNPPLSCDGAGVTWNAIRTNDGKLVPSPYDNGSLKGVGAPTGESSCGNIIAYFEDKIFPNCNEECANNENAYTVFRTWTLYDLCTNQSVIHQIYIVVTDDEAPVIKAPAEVTVSTDPWKCASSFDVEIIAEDNCGRAETLIYTLTGPAGVGIVHSGERGDNKFTIKDAPPTYEGPHIFTAYTTDCCGNQSEPYEIVVWVFDEVKPTAVAKEFTVASITDVEGEDDDIVKVYWTSINNGSWDACSELEYYVRRMDGDPRDCDQKDFFPYDYNEEKYTRLEAIELYYDEVECRTAEVQDDFAWKITNPNVDGDYDYGSDICNTGLIPYNGDEWGEYVKFCCADLNSNADDEDIDGDGLKNEHRVEMIVFDKAGNWNITWGWVKIEDPNPPVLEIEPYETFCHDEALNGSYSTLLDSIKAQAIKNVTAYGACDVDLTHLVEQGALHEEYWDPACKFGSGTIEYSIVGPKGTIVRGTQEYKIYYKDDFACDNIHGWTYDLDDPWYDAADNYDFRDNLDANCMSPVPENLTWDSGPCELIGWNMVSDTFQFEADACVKVINTWTVIDWCVYEYTKDEDEEKAKYLFDHWYEYQHRGHSGRKDEMMGISRNSCDEYFNLDHEGDLVNIDEGLDEPHWYSGVYTWTQIIKVTDQEAPVITPFDGDMITDSLLSGCVENIKLTLTGEDKGDCPASWLKWVLVEIDGFGGIATDESYPQIAGTTVVYELGNFSGPMETRYYRARAWDGCGNVDTYEFKYTLIDAKAPTPYCINLSTALMTDPDGEGELVPMVELWACDFDLGSFDNCTAQEELFFTFDGVAPAVGNSPVTVTTGGPKIPFYEFEQYYSENGLLAWNVNNLNMNFRDWLNPDGGTRVDAAVLAAIELAYRTGTDYEGAEVYRWLPQNFSDCGKYTSGKVYTEENIATGDEDGDGNVDVQMDVWDSKLNVDYCSVELTLRCTDCNVQGPVATVAGIIATETGSTVADVDVSLMNVKNPENVQIQKTEFIGEYAFVDNPMYQDYEITGFKEDAADEGVSTLDLVLIQRHILGLNTFDSPYKVIAADINNDGSLNATDLVILRKVILGIYEKFPENTSWKFIDASQELAVETVLSTYREKIEINNLDANLMNENMVAVKTGDVNGDARTNARDTGPQIRNTRTVRLTLEDRYVEKGEVVRLVFGIEELAEVYGFQFTFELAGLTFSTIESGEANIGNNNIALLDEQTMTVSYDDMNGLTNSDNLFTLVMESTEKGNLSKMIAITGKKLTNQAYLGEGLEVATIELNLEDSDAAEFSLKQNEPNPFEQVTYVGFSLPENAKAVLTIHDVAGKEVMKIEGDYVQGYNEVSISKSKIVSSGVYYYTLKSGKYSATKRMIIIE